MSADKSSDCLSADKVDDKQTSIRSSFSMDLLAIQRRNNEILRCEDMERFTSASQSVAQCDSIILTPEERQFFNRKRNQQIMDLERQKLENDERLRKEKRIEEFELEQDQRLGCDSRTFDVQRSRTLAIGRDRMNEKYANQIESTNMDDSSIICSLCQQFVLARHFWRHIDQNHHEYVSKLEGMNRQLFRNAGPVELDFPQQSEFDIETHSIGQIDHLAIYYCRAEHISTNSQLIHDFRPMDSRRRLCLVHRMNEHLESLKEKEKTKKKQAQAKEDKKLLTQENKKRKKLGVPMLTELPASSSASCGVQQVARKHYHHRGRSGLVNLTPVQILALKNRDFLHQNSDYQPRIRSLDFSSSSSSCPSSSSSSSSFPPSSSSSLPSESSEFASEIDSNRDKLMSVTEMLNFFREHNSKTVIQNSLQGSQKCLSNTVNSAGVDVGDDKDSDSDSDNGDMNDSKSSSVKHEFDDVFFEKMIVAKDCKADSEETKSDIKAYQSPIVRLINSCSHAQNRHLRRPKGDYNAKKIYKSRASEPYFAYERWNVRKNILIQRVDWSSAAISKYFPRFRSNARFMRYLSAKVIEFRNVPISRCVKSAILEAIADRKFFLNADVLKDISKTGQLKKIFRKLAKAEQKYEKYSNKGQRFQSFINLDGDKKRISDGKKRMIRDKREHDKFCDNNGIFFNENVNISGFPLPFPFSNNPQVHKMISQDSAQKSAPCNAEAAKPILSNKQSINSISLILKKLITLLFARVGSDARGFKKALSIEEYPLIYRELSNLSSEKLTMENNIRYQDLESALNHHFKSLQGDKSDELESPAEVYEMTDKTIVSDEEFSVTHDEYIGKILQLFDIHRSECPTEVNSYLDHDYLKDRIVYIKDMNDSATNGTPDIDMSYEIENESVKVGNDMQQGSSSKHVVADVQGNAELWNNHSGEQVTRPVFVGSNFPSSLLSPFLFMSFYTENSQNAFL